MTAHNIMGYWTNKAAGNIVGMYEWNVTTNFKHFYSQNLNLDIFHPQSFMQFKILNPKWHQFQTNPFLQIQIMIWKWKLEFYCFPKRKDYCHYYRQRNAKEVGKKVLPVKFKLFAIPFLIIQQCFIDFPWVFLIFRLLFTDRAVYIRGWYGCYASITSPWTIQSPQ